MKRFVFSSIAVGIASTVAMPAAALDVYIEPRFETGAMLYDFDFEGNNRVIIDGPVFPEDPNTDFGGEGLTVEGRSSLNFADTLPFIGGGGTLFVDRFFVDIGATYAFDGSDASGSEDANFLETDIGLGLEGQQIVTVADNDADFDRLELAVSVGYALTDHVAIFAGYKRAETDFDIRRNGFVRQDRCGDFGQFLGAGTGCATDGSSFNFTEDVELEFEHDGPFLGMNFLTDPISLGLLEGALSGNIAVAFLDGEIKQKETQRTVNRIDGTAPLPAQLALSDEKFEGDTTGLSAGVTWRGTTPVDRLTYSIGVSGYQYDFKADAPDPTQPRLDFSEAVVVFKAGIAYGLDF